MNTRPIAIYVAKFDLDQISVRVEVVHVRGHADTVSEVERCLFHGKCSHDSSSVTDLLFMRDRVTAARNVQSAVR
jgi:hypothetical protein